MHTQQVDSTADDFQEDAFELNHPVLCDAEHARFVLVRIGGPQVCARAQ
jgi:hypothetical protein